MLSLVIDEIRLNNILSNLQETLMYDERIPHELSLISEWSNPLFICGPVDCKSAVATSGTSGRPNMGAYSQIQTSVNFESLTA